MEQITLERLATYWSGPEVATSIVMSFGGQAVREFGYEPAMSAPAIAHSGGRQAWRFVVVDLGKGRETVLTDIAQVFASFEGIENFQLSRARN